MSNPVDPKEAVFLIVDDDGQVRDILTEYLNSFGFNKILHAKDGKAAIKIVQNMAQRLDVIISDWEMPHVDGLTLLRAVRKDHGRNNVKFLMVSSQSSHERMKISKAAKSRVDAYIVKPFRASVLKDKIIVLLNGGIDESSEEFDEAFSKIVPANKVTTGTGTVVVKTTPPVKTGTVKQKDTGLPPDSYDLSQMNVQLIVNLAKSYLKVKWFDKAIKLCTDAEALFPSNADLICLIGEGHFYKGSHEVAMGFFKQAIALQPYHVTAHSYINEIEAQSKAS